MSVSEVIVSWIQECSAKDVTCAFPVHRLDIFRLPDYQAAFKLGDWFWSNVDCWALALRRFHWNNLCPAFDNALADS